MTYTSSEKRRIILLTIAFTLIIMAPTVFGWLYQNSEYAYTGFHIMSPADYPVYYSYINQIKNGSYLLTDQFTTEAHMSSFNPFWLTLGLAGRLLNMDASTIFHLARMILTALFVITLYAFISRFIHESKERLHASLWLLLAGGVGFWATPFISDLPHKAGEYTVPPDLWTSEANTFLTLLHSPHFIASAISFLITLLLWTDSIKQRSAKKTVLAGIVFLIWMSFHPFHYITIALLLIGHTTILAAVKDPLWKTSFRHGIIIALISSPAMLYHAYVVGADTLAAVKTIQNITLTPRWWIMALGYGLLTPLAMVGWWQTFKKLKGAFTGNAQQSHSEWFLLLVWLPLQWIIIYVPLPYQRRLTQGLHIIIALFAWLGIKWLWQKYKTHAASAMLQSVLIPLLLLILGFSSFANWISEFEIIIKRMPHIYFSNDTVRAFEWLKHNTSPEDILLSDESTANFIPGFVPRRVYAGHGVETAYYHCCKGPLIRWFFGEVGLREKKNAFLRENNIDYIMLDTKLIELVVKKIPEGYTKDEISQLNVEEVFSSGTVIIYKHQPRI